MNGAMIRQRIACSGLGLLTLASVVPILFVIVYMGGNGAGAVTW